jgi:hypothetical protein
MADEQGITPPYVSFATFLTATDSLKELLSDSLDRTMFPSFSGGAYSQLLVAMRFLRFVNVEDGETLVTADLDRFVHADEGSRKIMLREILSRAYPDIMGCDLTRLSPKQLDDLMGNLGVTGTTKRKAVAFFLAAAQYADVPLSPLLTRKRRAVTTTAAKRNRRSIPRRPTAPELVGSHPPVSIERNTGGDTAVFTLPSGATISVSVSQSLMSLPKRDRDIVGTLLDKIETDIEEATTVFDKVAQIRRDVREAAESMKE